MKPGFSSIALFVRTFSPYGGVEKSCYEFYRYLRERGVPVTVFCGRNETEEGGAHIRMIPLWRPGRFLKTLSFYWGAELAVKALPPDVASLSYATVAGCTAFRSGGAHLDFVTGTLSGYPTRAARWWKAARRAANPINWLQPALDRAIYTHPGTRTIIAISGLVGDEVIRRFGLDPARVAVVENGVDTARFNREAARARRAESRAALGLSPGRVGVGFCSTNFELKGLAPLIEALAALPERFELLVAGKRDPAKYQRLADGLGLGGRVRFLGKVSDMPGFYAGIDVLCHPSFYDTFGNVVAEALAMGVPTVTTRATGACDLIDDRRTGRVLDQPEPWALANAIFDLREVEAGTDFGCVEDDEQVFARYLEVIEAVRAELTADTTG